MLESPAWPLCNMAIMLFLTGPYSDFSQLIGDMPEDIDIASITYPDPAKILTKHMDLLNIFETFKPPGSDETSDTRGKKPSGCARGQQEQIRVFSDSGKELEPFEAISAMTKQGILDRELGMLNSFLCGPCGCTLCCTGPEQDAEQDFFEIPLSSAETALFDLPVIDSEKSRKTDPYSADPLLIHGKPFYYSNPAMYRWHTGWSMILTRNSSCPALSTDGSCTVYQSRPLVCRKPQIFAYVLEKAGNPDYTLRNNLLAVWDCPYVRHLEDEITRYAALNETGLIFRGNKT